MGKVTGFREIGRITPSQRDTKTRTNDWNEVYNEWPINDARTQAGRCMDCGVPFCNNGCPLGNLIPEWNDLIYQGEWEEAIKQLHATNNFPEFTGRICPAPCEASCTLSINSTPVTIEMIEKQISEYAWDKGWINPEPPTYRTGKTIAIVGSGPAGLASAQQLNRAGHTVTVFERNQEIGGLLTLGIPEFKLEKRIVKRRVQQLEEEGIKFMAGVDVGIDITHTELLKQYDAICLAGGSTVPRNLDIQGRELKGVHYAMDYLTQQNRRLSDEEYDNGESIHAFGKHVIIIGGGDTGADCLGTAIRQKAANITQIEIMPRPPQSRTIANPWPQWPMIFRSSSAHKEGGIRDYNILSKQFLGDKKGNVVGLNCLRITNDKNSGGIKEVPGSEFSLKADLVLLAMGFLHPQHIGLLDSLELKYDSKGNVKTDVKMMTNNLKVFACGDMKNGQSLVVEAIASGRVCARAIDLFLMGKTSLPKVRGFERFTTQ